jgi:hypothetical protein
MASSLILDGPPLPLTSWEVSLLAAAAAVVEEKGKLQQQNIDALATAALAKRWKQHVKVRIKSSIKQLSSLLP